MLRVCAGSCTKPSIDFYNSLVSDPGAWSDMIDHALGPWGWRRTCSESRKNKRIPCTYISRAFPNLLWDPRGDVQNSSAKHKICIFPSSFFYLFLFNCVLRFFFGVLSFEAFEFCLSSYALLKRLEALLLGP